VLLVCVGFFVFGLCVGVVCLGFGGVSGCWGVLCVVVWLIWFGLVSL